jgi:hypothetical protein
VDGDARGCPRCALNFEAENMIDRLIWRRFVPALALLVLAIAVILFYVNR